MSADRLMQGFMRLAERAYPFLAASFRHRYATRAAVTASADGAADVQPLDERGLPDADAPPLRGLALPFYCESLAPGSVVRVAWERWSPGEPYVDGIVEAVSPVWRLASGAGTIRIDAAGAISLDAAAGRVDVDALGDVTLSTATGASVALSAATGIVTIGGAGPTVIDGIPYPPPV